MPPCASLELLPREILTHIAHDVAVLPSNGSTAPFAPGPPRDLLCLLCTSRTLHRELSTDANTALYAHIFASVFDTGARARRRGRTACTPAHLTTELVRRFGALKTVRRYVQHHGRNLDAPCAADDAHATLVDALWCVYMMALEHDAHNLAQLRWAHVDELVDLHAVHTLCDHLVHQRYPPAPLSVCLVIHIRYTLAAIRASTHNDAQYSDEHDYLFLLLKPFVFAAHEYAMFYGPWTARTLPSGRMARNAPEADADTDADRLATPLVSLAATSLLFACTARAMHASSLKMRLDARVAHAAPRTRTSRDFDVDYARLRHCYDAHDAPGLRLEDHVGRFAGVWEGRFAFFDLDAYRSMLDGSAAALYDGTFGEQTQVLRLSEAVVGMSSDGVAQYHEDILSDALDDVPGADKARRTPPRAPPAPARDGQQPFVSHADGGPPLDADTMLREWRRLPFWSDDDPSSAQDEQRELLLYGTGHSAWGKFFVRGRVRAWDGLVVLLKEVLFY
ncbi:hypothetical protein MBRA1_000366 [Malassezia brasiliensis]|uniref:F-box domain-containing protein n=1 Tax=Malassezia brasiliensis TaxID=1821822 RepID=A0AAF0DQU2_9BASI|nr:hypothetical protein MBRA1_000366 [Malassezia brasiliensis]